MELAPEASADEVSVAQNVFQLWNGGNQPAAVEALAAFAADEKKWAIGLSCWLRMQQGFPLIKEGVPFAKKAAALGMPWSAVNFFNNLIGHINQDPSLIETALDLATHTGPWWTGIDPVGQGWNLFGNGRFAEGIRLMGLSSPGPYTAAQWNEHLELARAKVADLDSIVAAATAERVSVQNVASESKSAIEKSRDDLETAAKQANLLVTSVVSDSTVSLFKADATRNEGESKKAWGWGLVVLGAAAIVAVLPLALHYAGRGPEYSTVALVGAHAASTAALATVAGVLLARARSRDLARQRANDLSTAMGTMISYSNQIRDEGEKQRFMMTMGQLVLQAHLTSGTSTGHGEESLTGLVALANILRAPTGESSGSK